MKLKKNRDLDLSTVLYDSECPNCLEKLYEFKYHPDADGGAWSTNCNNCGKEYYLSVTKVKLL